MRTRASARWTSRRSSIRPGRTARPRSSTALDVAKAIGAAGVPVFLYGELAGAEERRERSYFRTGGLEGLRRRMEAGELRADFGPELPLSLSGRDPGHGAAAACGLQRASRGR